jgi:hypothetical protein
LGPRGKKIVILTGINAVVEIQRDQDRQHGGVNLVPKVGGHYALIAIGFANIAQLMRNNG